jgi:hypothetical protein
LNLKLAFFGYAWGEGGHLDGYMAEAVNAYLGLGFDVDVYFAAEPTVGFKGGGLLERLVRHLRERITSPPSR